jgi:hypothetical protein
MEVGEDAEEVGGAAEAGQVGWRGTVDDAAAVGPAWHSPEMSWIVWWLEADPGSLGGALRWIFWCTCQSVMPATVSNDFICMWLSRMAKMVRKIWCQNWQFCTG